MPRIRKDVYPYKLLEKSNRTMLVLSEASSVGEFKIGDKVEMNMHSEEKWFDEKLTKSDLGYGVILKFVQNREMALIYYPTLTKKRDGWFGPQTAIIDFSDITKLS